MVSWMLNEYLFGLLSNRELEKEPASQGLGDTWKKEENDKAWRPNREKKEEEPKADEPKKGEEKKPKADEPKKGVKSKKQWRNLIGKLKPMQAIKAVFRKSTRTKGGGRRRRRRRRR